MSGIDLSVHRLRLATPPGVSAHALQARVEDAFRVASMPAALAHRFVLVRRLRLVLPRAASAQSLALHLEREWRAIEALAQPMASAGDDAPAVWAADESQARLLLLQRWLDARDARAWYWQRLLPTVHAAMPMAQRLRALLLEDFDAAPAHAAAAHGLRSDLWREALPRIEAARQWPVLQSVLSPVERELLIAAWRPVSTTLCDNVTAAPSVSRIGAAPVVRHMPPASRVEAGSPAGPEDAVERAHPAVPHSAGDRPTPSQKAAAPSARRPAVTDASRAATRTPAGSPPLQRKLPEPLRAAAELDGARETAWAGLWFLLPLLLRQGLTQEAAPAQLFAAILRQAAARHGLDAAAQQWIEQVSSQCKPAPAAPTLQAHAERWWRRARVVSVRQARLPLRRVLYRPGRVWLASHRVDLVLPLQQADVRIRRAGFDIDPGYVPWLDSVIHFHYL